MFFFSATGYGIWCPRDIQLHSVLEILIIPSKSIKRSGFVREAIGCIHKHYRITFRIPRDHSDTRRTTSSHL